MGLFTRRRREPMDEALTFMTVEEADALRGLVIGALAERGIDATTSGGDVATTDGAVFGLWNLATVCGSQDREEWPALVEEHISGLVTVATPRSPDEMSAEELLAAVRLRLSEESYVRRMPDPPGGIEPFAPGIVRHLVVETADSIQLVPEPVLTSTAALPELRAAADRHTRSLVGTTRVECEDFGAGAERVRIVYGDSPFTATFALYLDDVVGRQDPRANHPHGIVFAVPTRHQIVYHVPTRAEATRTVLPTMLRFAGTAYDEGAGPVSPELYHWDAGTVTALSAPGPDGRVEISPTGRLRDLLGD